ncbi:hypothetical protein [Streptomyces sp. NPDC058872]|uniref:hypothetical protein n=1 Tax=Streptomyces sp. NPDC058872 TaxID=3346661 RepID=UPI00367AF516
MSRTTISKHGAARTHHDGQEERDIDGATTKGGTGTRNRPGRALRWTTLAVGAGAGALLSVGAFLGVYVRPTSDDWCALWKTRDMGALGIASDFYRTQNGRVTNALLTGLLYTDGMRGPKLLPALLVVALGLGLFLLAREALRALRLPFPVVATSAAVLVVEALLFFAGTRAYQVLLWAPATLSHTLPSTIGVWAALSAVWAARSRRPWARSAAVGSAVLTGAAIGTLSEPFVAMSGLAASAAGVLCLPRLRLTHDRFASTWCAAWCLGLLVGTVVLVTSPGARWRRAQQPERPLSLAELGETFQDWSRIWETIGGQWAYAGALAVGVLLGLALAPRTGRPVERPNGPARGTLLIAAALPVPLIALGSLVSAYGLRAGYGADGWTYARTWTSFLLAFLLALCGYGAWLGYRLRLRTAPHAAPAGAPEPETPVAGDASDGAPSPAARAIRLLTLFAAGVVAAASTAALVPPVRTLTTLTVARALAWDSQDARIRAEAAAGAGEVAYRPLRIGSLAEPFFTNTPARDWVAQCAARYYRVDQLRQP